MLKWYSKLYIGENARKHQGQIITAVEDRRYQKDIYLLTLPLNPKNTMEIVPASNLIQKTVYNRTPMIFGVAEGYEEASELVRNIIQETYTATQTTDVASYLNSKE